MAEETKQTEEPTEESNNSGWLEGTRSILRLSDVVKVRVARPFGFDKNKRMIYKAGYSLYVHDKAEGHEINNFDTEEDAIEAKTWFYQLLEGNITKEAWEAGRTENVGERSERVNG